MQRIVVLGCGTGVGKTRVSVALTRALEARGCACLALKPVETGVERLDSASASQQNASPVSDAEHLSRAGSLRPVHDHPRYGFPRPISPHLAAREAGVELEIGAIVEWVGAAEAAVTPHVMSHRACVTLIETAGGVFSPLSQTARNFELARALEPALWVLVASDSLGVLHEVSATLIAMRALGREPDHLVLSAAREPDLSTGHNADEIRALGIATVSAVLARGDDSAATRLAQTVLERLK